MDGRCILATIATLPVMAALIHRGLGRPGRVMTLLIHFVFVAVVTRVADYTDSVPLVVTWSAVALVLACLAFALLSRRGALESDPVSP